MADGDYMADEDFNMMVSPSAAASSSMPPLPTPNSSAKELRADNSSAMRTEPEEFAEELEKELTDAQIIEVGKETHAWLDKHPVFDPQVIPPL